MSLGPVMMDVVGTSLTPEERSLLKHPLVGGVILFTRNFESVEQVTQLIEDIRALREPHLLISIDHEGGRVQRFHEGFTRIPAAASYGRIYDEDKPKGIEYAHHAAYVMALELRAIGVDFTFAPVLDLAHGLSGVIGDRAFHKSPDVVATLSYAYMSGLNEAGMSAVGKHFPGHGGVTEDSHLALPYDKRSLEVLLDQDIRPFAHLIKNGLPAIMPAHVIYSDVDDKPAGYSKIWLNDILRKQLNFQGVIFSDDLSMEAATIAGDYGQRAQQALDAGCDMVLVCNHPEGVAEVVESLGDYTEPASQLRLARMHGRHPITRRAMLENEQREKYIKMLEQLDSSPWIEMDV